MSSTTSNVIRHNDLVSRLRHASYATRSADQDTTHQSVTSEDAKQRTICFLVELVGFSISADTKQLASAMNAYTSADPETPSSTSVLSAEDRERLHDLALLAKRVHEKVLTNDINTTTQSERFILYQNIIQPAEALNVSGAYALHLISRYALHKCDPSKRKLTVLGEAAPPWPLIYFYRFMTADELFSLAKVIFNVSPNETVQFLLGKALREYQVKVFEEGKMRCFGFEINWDGCYCDEGFVAVKALSCKGEGRSKFRPSKNYRETTYGDD